LQGLINNPLELKNIWDTSHRYLWQEKQIKAENRLGKEHWMQLLNEAISCDEQNALKQGKPLLNYSNAILYSLSQTGRMVNPDFYLTTVRDQLMSPDY
jgi:hypothetical protein